MNEAAIKSQVQKWQAHYDATIEQTRRNLIYLEEYSGHMVKYGDKRYIFLEYEDDGILIQEEFTKRQVFVPKWFIDKIIPLYETKS